MLADETMPTAVFHGLIGVGIHPGLGGVNEDSGENQCVGIRRQYLIDVSTGESGPWEVQANLNQVDGLRRRLWSFPDK